MSITRLFSSAALVSAALTSFLLSGCGGGSATSSENAGLPSRYVVSLITKLPFQATFVDRNSDGYVIGYNYVGNAGQTWDDGFVISPSGQLTMIPDPDGFSATMVKAINNREQIIGHSRGAADSDGAGFVYDLQTGTTTRLSAMNNPAGINDSGKVVGSDSRYESSSLQVKGIVYDIAAGTTTELPHGDDIDIFWATDINNAGLVAGQYRNDLALYNLQGSTLKTVSPTGKYDGSSSAFFITDTGLVSGIDHEARDWGESRPFIYNVVSGNKTYVPESMLVDNLSIPINASGTAVLGDWEHSYVYRNGIYNDLSTMLSTEDLAAWKIREPFAIDDSGVIYAEADKKGEPESESSTYLIRLTPQ